MLKNESKLSEYIKEDDKTIHLVEHSLQNTGNNQQNAGNIPSGGIRTHVQSIGVAAVIQGNAPNNNIRWTTYGSYPQMQNNSIQGGQNYGFQEPAPQSVQNEINNSQQLPNQQQQQINQNIPIQNTSSGNQAQ